MFKLVVLKSLCTITKITKSWIYSLTKPTIYRYFQVRSIFLSIHLRFFCNWVNALSIGSLHLLYRFVSNFADKCKSYMKITQYSRGRKVKEIYSPYVTAAQEVRYNFKINLKIESNATLYTFVVISVKVRGFFKKDVLVGRIIFGPFLYAEYGKSLTPWGRALLHYEPVSHIYRMYL